MNESLAENIDSFSFGELALDDRGYEMPWEDFNSAIPRDLSSKEKKQLRILARDRDARESICPIVSFHSKYAYNGESCIVCGYAVDEVLD